MSPWDRYRLQWRDHYDGSGGVSSCGDVRIHDELVIESGDIRPELVSAVLAHDLERVSAVLNAAMRMNRRPWQPVMSPARRVRVEALIGWNAKRYGKW